MWAVSAVKGGRGGFVVVDVVGVVMIAGYGGVVGGHSGEGRGSWLR